MVGGKIFNGCWYELWINQEIVFMKQRLMAHLSDGYITNGTFFFK